MRAAGCAVRPRPTCRGEPLITACKVSGMAPCEAPTWTAAVSSSRNRGLPSVLSRIPARTASDRSFSSRSSSIRVPLSSVDSADRKISVDRWGYSVSSHCLRRQDGACRSGRNAKSINDGRSSTTLAVSINRSIDASSHQWRSSNTSSRGSAPKCRVDWGTSSMIAARNASPSSGSSPGSGTPKSGRHTRMCGSSHSGASGSTVRASFARTTSGGSVSAICAIVDSIRRYCE